MQASGSSLLICGPLKLLSNARSLFSFTLTFEIRDRTYSVYTMESAVLTTHFTDQIACQWCSGSVIIIRHHPQSSLPYSVYVVSEILCYCNVTGLPLAANHVPLVARVILLERVICFPCFSEYRHNHPWLTSPAQPGNITFISMICHFRCCPRLFLHNTCRTSDDRLCRFGWGLA